MRNLFSRLWRGLTNPRYWGYGLFWSWNTIFLAFMLLGFGPRMLPELLRSVRSGEVPPIFLMMGATITAIPLLTVLIAALWLRREPGRLFALGYVVEGPLMLLLAVRFFVVGELTSALGLIFGLALLGMLAFLWQLLDRRIDQRHAFWANLQLLGLTVLLVVNLYAALWLAFYAVPLGIFGAQAFWELLTTIPELLVNLGGSLRDIINDFRVAGLGALFFIPFLLLSSLLFGYTATLFVLTPLAVPVLTVRAWWRSVQALNTRFRTGWLQAGLVALLTAGLCIALFVGTNRQPQHQAFSLLAEPPASPAAAQALLTQEESIRNGLLNAYLAQQRYISAVGEVYHIRDLYEHGLRWSSQRTRQVEQWYEWVARPLLYEPAQAATTPEVRSDPRSDPRSTVNPQMRQEGNEAERLYQQFFDQPISQGERSAIVRSVRTTWSAEQALRNWQAVDEREVHLSRQEISVAEQGDWAEVELYEVYVNRTPQQQEVLYYFSLPETAVITGVWLGESADRSQRFAYKVAPRGAAQAVYQAEVSRRVDPALVEQIGPRQYRLRAFPIEPRQSNWDEDSQNMTTRDGPPMHLWLTYRVLVASNSWPLPRLAEQRNVYWDEQTIRIVNGQPAPPNAAAWLPASIAAQSAPTPQAHRVDFPTGESVLITPLTPADDAALPADLRLAVVVDRSRSMARYSAEMAAALQQIQQLAATVDLYLTASAFRGEAPSRVPLAGFNPAELLYLGGQNPAELLTQFNQLQQGASYDAILVLTDGSAYELGESGLKPPVPSAPLWLVHLGGEFPLGYDDPTLDAIQASGGGITASLAEALTRLAIAERAPTQATHLRDLIDGYTWVTLPTAQIAEAGGATLAADAEFAPLAARRLILTAMQRQRGRIDQIATLDTLHEIAVRYGIVTPLSSMIVLVNERQEKLLDEAAAQADRFEREVEAVDDPLANNALNGVPEPEEWLLLLLVMGLVGWYWRNQRQRSQFAAETVSARFRSGRPIA